MKRLLWLLALCSFSLWADVTGPVTGTGGGALSPIPSGTILGNSSGSTAAPSALTALPAGVSVPAASLTGLLNVSSLTGQMLPVNGGTGVASITGIVKGNGTSNFSVAAAADAIALWTGTCASTTFLRGDGTCAAVNPVTSGTITSVAITGTAGQFSCTCFNLAVGQSVTIVGTLAGTGSITGYANPTTYYVSATNGTSTFTLQTTGQAAIVTTAGTLTGLWYSVTEATGVFSIGPGLSLVGATLSATGATSGSGISGVTQQNTVHLRACIAQVRAGTARCKIAFIGDSTMIGAYSNGSQWGSNAKSLSVTRQLAQILAGKVQRTLTGLTGPTAREDSFYGTGNVGVLSVYLTYNTQVTNSGLSVDTADVTLGLNPFTGTGTFSFTPTNAFDTIEILAWGNGTSTITVNVDGGSTLATFTPTASSNGVQVFTVSSGITLGTHTVNMITSASGIAIVGASVRTSTAPAIELFNFGISGSTAATWNTAIGNANVRPLAALGTVAPNVTFINLTINDINTQPTSVATYSASLQLFITKALASGDCILMVGNPSNPSGNTNWAPPATIPYQYIAAVYALAAANNIPVIDLTQRWVSYAFISPAIAYGDGNVHPSGVGYADIAAAYGALFQ